MTKYRKLHTQILESPDFTEMPDDFTRVTWVLLMLVLDSKGRGVDSARAMQSKIYPTREDVSIEQVQIALDYFADHGMITRYQAKGRRYFYQTNFEKYQGDTRKEAASLYPDPVIETNDDTQELGESSASASQELGESKSASYSYSDADSYSHADTTTNTETDAEALPAEPPVATIADVFSLFAKLDPRRQVTAIQADDLKDLFEEHGGERLVFAIHEASTHSAPTLAYIKGVLKGNGKPPVKAKASAVTNTRWG